MALQKWQRGRNGAALQWFVSESRTAHIVRSAFHSQLFADCPYANAAISAALVAAVSALVAVLTGTW